MQNVIEVGCNMYACAFLAIAVARAAGQEVHSRRGVIFFQNEKLHVMTRARTQSFATTNQLKLASPNVPS